MKKRLKKLMKNKSTYIGGLFITLGILLCFIPNISKYIVLSHVDLGAIMKEKWGWICIPICICTGIGLIGYSWIHTKTIIIIKQDGLSDTVNYDLDVHSLAIIKYHHYFTKINNDNDIQNNIGSMLSEFKKNNSKDYLNSEYIYYGISYIPFVFLLGSLYGDDSKTYSYAHYYRNESSTTLVKLKEEKENTNDKLLNISYEKRKTKTDNLLVTIACSFLIDDISEKYFKSMDMLSFTAENIGVNSIDSLNILEKYCETIVSTIREKCHLNNYKTIHLFISSCTELVFRLGTVLTNNYDPKIMIYHYDKKNVGNERHWGIDISNQTAFITPKEI